MVIEILITLLILVVTMLGGIKMLKSKIKGTSLEKQKDSEIDHENPTVIKEEKPPQYCTKKRFNTEVEAQMVVALHENKRKINKSTHRKEQKVYLCPLCGYFHVSSQTKSLKESEK